MTNPTHSRLTPESRKELRDELAQTTEHLKNFVTAAKKARENGEISESALNAISTLSAGSLEYVLQLIFGLMVGFVDPREQQHDVSKPVADSELPDWNLVTNAVPDN